MADSSQLILSLILRHLHHFWINCVLCQIHAENSQKRIKEQPNSKKLMQYEKKKTIISSFWVLKCFFLFLAFDNTICFLTSSSDQTPKPRILFTNFEVLQSGFFIKIKSLGAFFCTFLSKPLISQKTKKLKCWVFYKRQTVLVKLFQKKAKKGLDIIFQSKIIPPWKT